MNDPIERKSKLAGLLSRGRGIWGVIVIAAVAFLLGAILFGGRDVADDTAHDDLAEEAAAPELWSCSMHPQIKLPGPGKCPICFMDLIPLEFKGGDDLGPRQLRLSETAKQLAQIQTTPARRAFAEAEVRMVGRLAYDETKVAYITAWVPGRLDRLFADFTGISVSKGDHLVDMYSPELLSAQEELIQAQSAVTRLSNTSSTVLRSTAQATLEATRDKLRLWGLTPEQVETIERTGQVSDHLTIYAPIGGVVIHKDAKEGMYVATGTRIYTIADLSELWVMFEAYESDLPWLRYGQLVEFTSPSFPGPTFEAYVSFIDPLVDPKTRTVRVRAVVDNHKRQLKPDMFVRGVLKSRVDGQGNIVDEYLGNKWMSPMHPEVVKDGPGKCDVCGMDLVPASSLGYVTTEQAGVEPPLLIPVSAPMITGRRAIVYVEIPNEDGPLFEGREVELGPRAGDVYVVRSGIEEGELVVTNGAFKIDSELQIHAKPSMMSPDGGVRPSSHDHGQTDHKIEIAPELLEISDASVDAVAPVYNKYFDVQMALAKDDLATAKREANNLANAIADVDMAAFSRDGHTRWMDLSKTMKAEAKRMAGAADIVVARDAFYNISNATIALHRTVGNATGQTFYLAHCPMARDGDGADWLQNVKTVWNSYWGDAMLRCGTTRSLESGKRGDS